MRQRQFLNVVDEETARRRFAEALGTRVARSEDVPLEEALGRVLFEEVRAEVDVPGFDRSNVDGFAVKAADTFGAEELTPARLRLSEHASHAGRSALPDGFELSAGEALPVATGAVLPRGADAVVMVEDTAPLSHADGTLEVYRALAPGAYISRAGSDLGRGEVVLRPRERLGSRETGLLAAVGRDRVTVYARPRVAVLSTGDEIRPPGSELALGEVFDSNARILCDAVRECGGEPAFLGIVRDDEAALDAALRSVLCAERKADLVLLSGGTSKGAGDRNYHVVEALARAEGSPGIVVHGVALKPGKPLCLAVVLDTPVVILPGFPTSAVFTYHEFVAPLVRALAGLPEEETRTVEAVAPFRIPSASGRTEYCLVDLVPGPSGLAAYPIGAGSGSVRTFSRADGFLRIDAHTEYVAEGERVRVRPLGDRVRPADLIAVGSHCIGLDYLLSELNGAGYRTKAIAIGSQGGLAALARGEGDVAGTHLLDAATGAYNTPFLGPKMRVLFGYGRRQGVVFRIGDERFAGADLRHLAEVVRSAGVRMVNRNKGSGTRVLYDRLLCGAKPPGYDSQVTNHHAVAAAVAQGRADWGITLDVLAASANLGFVFVQEERFELVVRTDREERPGLAALRDLVGAARIRTGLADLGLVP